MAKNEHGLTAQQEKFAQGVVAGLSQSAAYREAYPKSQFWQAHTVHIQASALAAQHKVSVRIMALQKKAEEQSIISRTRILDEIGRVALSDIRNITRPDGSMKLPHELDAATAASVASFEMDQYGTIKYKFWDKNAALEKAAKHIGLYQADHQQRTDPLEKMLSTLAGKVLGVSTLPQQPDCDDADDDEGNDDHDHDSDSDHDSDADAQA